MICSECYSDKPRITPLINPLECLKNHTQYICGICKRAICIDENKNGLRRYNFPFKTLEIAKLYLRTADYINKTNCGIYKLESKKNRVFYKIFKDDKEMEEYVKKHSIINTSLEFQIPFYKEYKNTIIKRLKMAEISKYMNERK